MKLSEAILLGSIGTEQGFGPASMYVGNRCAMGAALFSITDVPNNNLDGLERMGRHWPWIDHLCVPAPADIFSQSIALGQPCRIVSLIWMLNDLCKWTRPQIAAWVATIEPQNEPIEEPQDVLEVSV